MTLTPEAKKYAAVAVIGIILSLVSGYFARDFKKQRDDEKVSRETVEREFASYKSQTIIKLAQMERKLSSAKGTRVAVVSGEVVRNADGNPVLEQYEQTLEEMNSVMLERDEIAQALRDSEQAKIQLVERIKELESSKPSVKRFGVLGIYNFTHWTAGPGFHQDFGIVDVGLYGWANMPDLNTFSLAINARF